MSGNRSKKKLVSTAPSKPSATATRGTKAPEAPLASKPVAAQAKHTPGNYHVADASHRTTELQSVQQKSLNGTALSSKSGPIPKGPAPQIPATNIRDSYSTSVRNMPTVGKAFSKPVEPEIKPETVPNVTTRTSPVAANSAVSTSQMPEAAVPAARASKAPDATAVSSTLGHYINLAVQAYTKPVYYSAGAAVGLWTAVRSELGLTKCSK